jgi:hypothetical protein
VVSIFLGKAVLCESHHPSDLRTALPRIGVSVGLISVVDISFALAIRVLDALSLF